MTVSAQPGPDSIFFGPFRLNARGRVLQKDGLPIALGGRALDILIALVECAGSVVAKETLIARVWPDITVEEVGLRVHIANLRKALGDGKDGARYIANVAGRGYIFVAPLNVSPGDVAAGSATAPINPVRRLPPRIQTMVGRDQEAAWIAQTVHTHRFVTVTGPGGIGKTTVAVAVAHDLEDEFPGGVYFADLAAVHDPALVPGTLVAALGDAPASSDAMATLLSFFRDKQALLLLDNCEHVIDAAAAAAERIFQEATDTCIIATSREPLRVQGEYAHRLLPLDSPSLEGALTTAGALAFPAVQLFIERATAADSSFTFDDGDAASVSRICRMLDGIPLTIELAASQVTAHGVEGLSYLIGDRLAVLVQGRRTAPARHQTLQALMDWSYDLLSSREQRVLRDLSRFSARFNLTAAKAIASDEDTDLAPIAAVLASLVSKSLVSREMVGREIRYRLLETTREYARSKLNADDDADAIARRQATYLIELLNKEYVGLRSNEERWLTYSEVLGDVRSALEWSFSERGDAALAKSLAQRATGLFGELSLLSESIVWAQAALALSSADERETRDSMELQAALAVGRMFTEGNSTEVQQSLEDTLALAQRLGEPRYEFRLNGCLHIFAVRAGQFLAASRYGRQAAAVAQRLNDSAAAALADAMLCETSHRAGDHAAAKRHCDAAANITARDRRTHAIQFGYDLTNRARACRAALKWLDGFPDQAVASAKANVREAAELGHPVTLCVSLIYASQMFLVLGDLKAAEETLAWFEAHHQRHGLTAYRGVALGIRGKFEAYRGDLAHGIDLIEESLVELRAIRYNLYVTPFASTIAEALAATGDAEKAIAIVDDLLANVSIEGDGLYVPDLLRIKGKAQSAVHPANLATAEATLLEAIAVSRRTGMLAFELRSANDLARLYLKDGQAARAGSVLRPIYDRFTEGFGTADLARAKSLLRKAEVD